MRRVFYILRYILKYINIEIYVVYNRFKIFLQTGYFSNIRITGSFHLDIHPKGKLILGNNIRMNSGNLVNTYRSYHMLSIRILSDGLLIIGDNAGISNSTFIVQKKITIGSRTLIGGGCLVCDSDLHDLTTNRNRISAEISIGVDCFIGGGSIVLKGVSIGNNCIIGAGTVISKSIEEGKIVVGQNQRELSNLNRR